MKYKWKNMGAYPINRSNFFNKKNFKMEMKDKVKNYSFSF